MTLRTGSEWIKISVLAMAISAGFAFGACGEATLISQFKADFGVIQGYRYFRAAGFGQDGSLFRNFGPVMAPSGTQVSMKSHFNSGVQLENGAYFVPTQSAAAGVAVIGEVYSSTYQYNTVYVSLMPNGANYDFTVVHDRTPDCSASDACNERRRSGTVSDANVAATSCTSGSLTTTMTTTTSEADDTYSIAIPSSGNTTIVCRRVQDTSSAVNDPLIYARWVRAEVTGTGGGSAAYAFEDTTSRCR